MMTKIGLLRFLEASKVEKNGEVSVNILVGKPDE